MRNVSCKVCSGGPGDCTCDGFCGSHSCSWKIVIKRGASPVEKIVTPTLKKPVAEQTKPKRKSLGPHSHMSGDERCDCAICETYLEMMLNNPAGWLHGVEHVNEGNHPLYRDYSEKLEPKPWTSAKIEEKKEPVVPKLSEWS